MKINRYYLKRFFEILPGTITWSAIFLPIILSLWLPMIIAIYAIIFNLYWLYRSLFLAKNILIAYQKMKHDTKKDWIKEIQNHEKDNKLWPRGYQFSDTWHVIIMPQYKESFSILYRSLDSYIKANFPLKEKMIFVLTSEIRNGAKELNEETFKQLKTKYEQHFYRFYQTFHPPDIPGEMACKSSNSTWGAKFFQKEFLDKNKISYDAVVIHNFDADTQIHPQYFANVSYHHLMTPKDLPTSYQPIHVPSDNIWHTGAVMRIVSMSMTTADLHNSLRPHRFKNFSSRSDCFQNIVDIGYWVVDAIPEDSRQYFDSLYYYKGNYWVQPIYVPVLLDAVLDETIKKTIKTQYQQLRRWAWGVSDFAYTMMRAFKDRSIPWRKKAFWSLRLLESHFSWAVAAIHISIIGWMPLWINPSFNESVFGFNLPTFTRTVINIAVIGLITVVYISLRLIPPRPVTHSRLNYLKFLAQWLIFPIVSLFFSSLAAIDAQTRLMFGKYLEYQVTAKAVKK